MDRNAMERMAREKIAELVKRLYGTKFEPTIPTVEHPIIVFDDLGSADGKGGIFEGTEEHYGLAGPGIVVHEKPFCENPEKYIDYIIVHEFAHVVQHFFYKEDERYLGHNKYFREIMKMFGAKCLLACPGVFKPRYKYKVKRWKYRCPICAEEIDATNYQKNKIEYNRENYFWAFHNKACRVRACKSDLYINDPNSDPNMILLGFFYTNAEDAFSPIATDPILLETNQDLQCD